MLIGSEHATNAERREGLTSSIAGANDSDDDEDLDDDADTEDSGGDAMSDEQDDGGKAEGVPLIGAKNRLVIP